MPPPDADLRHVDHQVVDIHRLAVAPCLSGHLDIVSSAVGPAPGGPPGDVTRSSGVESNLEKSATDALSLIGSGSRSSANRATMVG